MSRSRLTIAVALTLTATYELYAQWAESFTRIRSELRRPLPVGDAPTLPHTFVSVARRVLPGEEWMQAARYTFQRGEEFFIYANSVETADDAAGARVRFAPFVLVWIDPQRPEATPYVVHCEAARVQFENPVTLDFDAPNPGRLLAATLDGPVEITGPDGLAVHGANFDFSEEALSLYSAYPVRFGFGPTEDSQAQVRGSADGVQINFSPSFEPVLGKDMPRIGGVERIRLQRDVVLDCTFEERDDDGQPRLASAHITCDDSLDYHTAERYATLLKNVLVRRPTGGRDRPQECDTLRCHLLALHFAESLVEHPDSEATAASGSRRSPRVRNPFAGLRFKELKAVGNRAVLQSDEHRLVANMHELHYDTDAGVATLSDREAVRVQRDQTQLTSPVIRIMHTAGRGQLLECLGQGRLDQARAESGDPLLAATWSERLRAAPDPQTGLLLIRIDGEARLIQPAKAGLRADHLALWIDQELAGGSDGGSALAAAAARLPGEHGPLPLRFAQAEGGVVMATPELRVETELLQAAFEAGSLPHGPPPARPAGGGEAQATEPDVWTISSRRVLLKLLSDPSSRDVQVAEATAEGEVVVLQTRPPETGPDAHPSEPLLSLSGTRLQLVNQGHTQQVLNVIGAPALMRRGNMRLEGSDLRLDRGGNRASIVGEGLMQLPVDRDLSGIPLQKPMLLDVKWQEGMTFDGQRATFLKNVLLRLNDSLLQCEEMVVRVDRPLRFTDERPDLRELQIRDVQCEDGVHVEIYEWDENRLVGIRKGDLSEFVLDYQTGEFQGAGPAVIHHWSRTDGRRLAIAPRTSAQANQPVQSDPLEWEHINVRFDDLVTGNFKQRTAELHGRVRMIYAPVRRVTETFSRDDLSSTSPSVEHAVWLGCDMLTISMHPRPPSPDAPDERAPGDYLMIGAVGRCELEGNLFHAKADNLSYDESKMLFTLRGKGDRVASIYYQEQPGADTRRIQGRTIQFVPSKKQVGGIEGVQ